MRRSTTVLAAAVIGWATAAHFAAGVAALGAQIGGRVKERRTWTA